MYLCSCREQAAAFFEKGRKMAEKYYLAVDIGASSGRHILAHMKDGKIVLEEIYRFYNGNDIVTKEGKVLPDDGTEPAGAHRVWNTDRLFSEVIAGMKKCRDAGKIPVSMGIDTWGVDYVLLDEQNVPVGPCYAYRDHRTDGMDEKVYAKVSRAKLYKRTGIQRAIFNTIFQLEADKVQEPERLSKAKSLLMVPDYLHFRLTGVKKQEYTNASTTGLLDAKTADWDHDLIRTLGFPEGLFGELSMPGTVVGNLLPEVQEECGLDTTVVLPATHDTGSAVMSLPVTEETKEQKSSLYISSGTWSLFGTELPEACCTETAEKANFTNEGGYDRRYRFLKNIMGLWMIQEARKEFMGGWNGCPVDNNEERYSFAALCDAAANEEIASLVDANDEVFLAPASMAGAVQEACRVSGQEVPETPAQVARVIYRSLAACYREAAEQLSSITGRPYDTIDIIGGGSNAVFLNELTAEETGMRVLAGPGEATAIGNIGAQMLRDGVFSDLSVFRLSVGKSFNVKEFLPKG